jgi:hypothetical protein
VPPDGDHEGVRVMVTAIVTVLIRTVGQVLEEVIRRGGHL